LARLEHYGLQDQRVLVYDLVVVNDGVLDYLMFRSPLTVRVLPAASTDLVRWDGEWLRPLWPVAPLGSLQQRIEGGRVFVRGTELATDRSMLLGSVVAKLPARDRNHGNAASSYWQPT